MKVASSNPTRARPELCTQPYYEVPLVLQAEDQKNAGINMGLVSLFPRQWTKFCSSAAKEQIMVQICTPKIQLLKLYSIFVLIFADFADLK